MRGLASHEGDYLAPSPIPKIAAAYQSNMINWLMYQQCDQKVIGNEPIMMIKIKCRLLLIRFMKLYLVRAFCDIADTGLYLYYIFTGLVQSGHIPVHSDQTTDSLFYC